LQQQQMPVGCFVLVPACFKEYGDDGIGHDDVKDFFNDAYAHKTLLITLLITLCRWMIHIQSNWFLDGTVQLYTCMNSPGLVSLVYREIEQCCCCIFTPAFTIAPLLLSLMDRFRSAVTTCSWGFLGLVLTEGPAIREWLQHLLYKC
jgi:hypothetical protein